MTLAKANRDAITRLETWNHLFPWVWRLQKGARLSKAELTTQTLQLSAFTTLCHSERSRLRKEPKNLACNEEILRRKERSSE